MKTRGKFVLTLLLLTIVGFGLYSFWDRIMREYEVAWIGKNTPDPLADIDLIFVQAVADEFKTKPVWFPSASAPEFKQWQTNVAGRWKGDVIKISCYADHWYPDTPLKRHSIYKILISGRVNRKAILHELEVKNDDWVKTLKEAKAYAKKL